VTVARSAPASLAAPSDLLAIADQARTAGQLGIDTEFMSEGRYRALLCLVSVAVPAVPGAGAASDADGDGGQAAEIPVGLPKRVELIDPLDERIDPAPLATVLADPRVEVIVHAGRQDVALLRRVWQTEVTNLFDTQIAAGFAGFGAQTGYGGLLLDVLGLRLPKSASFTRWDVRPLTAEQVGYSRDDVIHLLPLASDLQQRLAVTGRLEWAREECRRLEGSSDERDPDLAWQRLPRIGQLNPAARAVARELAAWRERTAAEEDRPVGSVLADASLVEIAKRRPASFQALERTRGIPPATLRRRSAAVLDAVLRGMDAEPLPLENGERIEANPADAPLIALGEALVRARALDAGLAYELIATRTDLAQIVAAVRRGRPEPPTRTLRGWRRSLIGEELLELLAGKRSLAIGPGGRMVITQN